MKRTMYFPAVAGKTVDQVGLHEDPQYGREVTITFTDGTELSIAIAVEQVAEARYFRLADNKTFFEQGDVEAEQPTVEV